MVLVLTVAHRPRGTHLGPPTPTGARPHPAAVLAAQRERESGTREEGPGGSSALPPPNNNGVSLHLLWAARGVGPLDRRRK